LIGKKNMLKLVVNNTHSFSKNAQFNGIEATNGAEASTSRECFLVNFLPFAPNLYTFCAFDSNHGLASEMNVEIKEGYTYVEGKQGETDKYLSSMAFCNFPVIDTRQLTEKVCGDKFLQSSIMLQFHLKILEQLILFCKQKDANKLVLTLDEVIYDDLEIYRHFASAERQVATPRGEQTEIVISSDVDIYDELIDIMDEFDSYFRKGLWRYQKFNPLFRKYLIGNS
jgi:hypothetical protein